jgi:hypothetical protein
MRTLNFSNGLLIDASKISSIVSNQQEMKSLGDIGELQHLLNGRPSSLTIRLIDGSVVTVNAGGERLSIHLEGEPA